MGQIALILVVIAVGIVLWRSLGKAPKTRRPPAAPVRPAATELRRDPETGVYHPVEHEKR